MRAAKLDTVCNNCGGERAQNIQDGVEAGEWFVRHRRAPVMSLGYFKRDVLSSAGYQGIQVIAGSVVFGIRTILTLAWPAWKKCVALSALPSGDRLE